MENLSIQELTVLTKMPRPAAAKARETCDISGSMTYTESSTTVSVSHVRGRNFGERRHRLENEQRRARHSGSYLINNGRRQIGSGLLPARARANHQHPDEARLSRDRCR